MEEELNYLSERIEELDEELGKTKINLGIHYNSQQANVYYETKLKAQAKEKQILENVLSALTISELN